MLYTGTVRAEPLLAACFFKPPTAVPWLDPLSILNCGSVVGDEGCDSARAKNHTSRVAEFRFVVERIIIFVVGVSVRRVQQVKTNDM
jgi:hypothetical protein